MFRTIIRALNKASSFYCFFVFTIAIFSVILVPSICMACACGCGVFDVGTSSMLPNGPGGMFYLEYDYQDQNRNWSGTSRAPAADNEDQEIRTHFMTAGVQYLFNAKWGIQADIPFANRFFRSMDEDGNIGTSDWWALGDIKIRALYTGFSPTLSTGLSFGLKLPTGNFRQPDVDRDTQIGTGSTDFLLGFFHRGSLTKNGKLTGFVQVQFDVPMLIQDHYRPGFEVDAATGLYYGFWLGKVKISPLAQMILSERTSDTGANSADPVASGYQRILLSPGVEFDISRVRIYTDVEFPVYQNMTGNQLVAPFLLKSVVSYMF